jgi:hypothetical protein
LKWVLALKVAGLLRMEAGMGSKPQPQHLIVDRVKDLNGCPEKLEPGSDWGPSEDSGYILPYHVTARFPVCVIYVEVYEEQSIRNSLLQIYCM